MLDSAPVFLAVGVLLGFLSGIGVGGGSLLMLLLTLVMGLDYNVARSINLLFFLPTALIASVFRWRQATLPVSKVLVAAVCGCIAAACFCILGKQMDMALLKKLFGVLLLVTGVRELFYRPRKDK